MTRTLFGAVCLSLQPLVLNIVSVPAIAYVIHRLGPEGFGQWTVATALLGVCAILTSLGLRGSFVRAVAARPEMAAEALAEQLGLRLMLVVPAAVIAVVTAVLLGYPAATVACVGVGVVGLGLTTLASTLGDVLQALHRSPTLAGASLGAGLTLTGLSVVVAWAGGGPVAVAGAYLSGPAVLTAVLARAVRAQVGAVRVRVDWRACGRLLHGARHFAAQQALAAASAQAELLVGPRIMGVGAFGFFSAGAMPASRLTVIPDALCTAAYPAMVREAGTLGGRPGRLAARFAAIGVGGGVLMAVGGMVVAEPLGRLLFPADPGPFASVVRVTMWALPLVAVESVLGYALNAAGREREQARASVPAAVLSLLTSVVLVASLGLVGACWSMVCRPAIRALCLAPVAWRAFSAARGSESTGRAESAEGGSVARVRARAA